MGYAQWNPVGAAVKPSGYRKIDHSRYGSREYDDEFPPNLDAFAAAFRCFFTHYQALPRS